MGACWRSASCSITTATSTVDDAPTAADDASPADDATANDAAANDAAAHDAAANDAAANDAVAYDATTHDAAWLSPAANDAATSTRLWLPNVGPATDDATATYTARSRSLLPKIRSRSCHFLLPEVQTSAD